MTACWRAALLTLLALLAFTANSILARAALTATPIDPVTFTAIRIASGALMLWMIVWSRSSGGTERGSWRSAAALFVYAIMFSLAYRSLTAATGALLLFGAVQVTMVSGALLRGEWLAARQWFGFALAVVGLVWLLLPGLAAPPPAAAAMMMIAGAAWGIYSLRGVGHRDPTRMTAANFALASVPALVLAAVLLPRATVDFAGAMFAVASGALASGLGYAVWYTALKHITTQTAAVAQLSVPLLTALAGLVLLGEAVDARIALSGVLLLSGIALVIHRPPAARAG